LPPGLARLFAAGKGPFQAGGPFATGTQETATQQPLPTGLPRILGPLTTPGLPTGLPTMAGPPTSPGRSEIRGYQEGTSNVEPTPIPYTGSGAYPSAEIGGGSPSIDELLRTGAGYGYQIPIENVGVPSTGFDFNQWLHSLPKWTNYVPYVGTALTLSRAGSDVFRALTSPSGFFKTWGSGGPSISDLISQGYGFGGQDIPVSGPGVPTAGGEITGGGGGGFRGGGGAAYGPAGNVGYAFGGPGFASGSGFTGGGGFGTRFGSLGYAVGGGGPAFGSAEGVGGNPTIKLF
jgi:hypothetical protein